MRGRRADDHEHRVHRHEIIHALWKALDRRCPSAPRPAGRRRSMPSPPASRTTAPLRDVPVGRRAGRRRRRGRDGFHLIGISSPWAAHAANLETYEQLYPVRFIAKRCAATAPAPAASAAAPAATTKSRSSRRGRLRVPWRGVGAPSSFGAPAAAPGVGGEVTLTLADGHKINAPKYGVQRHGPGTYRALSPGGGGFGDPRTRDPARVLRACATAW